MTFNIDSILVDGTNVDKPSLRAYLRSQEEICPDDPAYNATGDSVADDYTAVNNAATAAAGKTLRIKRTHRIGTNLTIGQSVRIAFDPGARLIPDAGITIRMDASMVSGPQRITYAGNFTWAAASLNAHMCVADGVLFIAEYSNAKVVAFNLADPLVPTKIAEWTVASQPRDVLVIGKHLFVACHGAAKIEIYDISNLNSPSLCYTLNTDANPKRMVIDGNYLFVACYGTSKVWKFRIDRLSNYPVFGDIVIVAVDSKACTTPYDIASNGAGTIACVGAGTDIMFFGRESLYPITVTVAGATFGTCAFGGRGILYAGDNTHGRLYVIDCSNFGVPAVIGYINVNSLPEQITIVGNRLYLPQLTASGTACVIDAIDISNPYLPYKFASIPLSVTGAGFTAYHNGHLYVDSHFTPYNVDILHVEFGDERPSTDFVKDYGVFDLLSTKINCRGQRNTNYRTLATNGTSTSADHVIRLDQGAALALHDPASTNPATGSVDGQELIITNVSGAAASSNITNAHAGYSGTLAAGASVRLMACTYSGTSQWDKVG